MLMLRSSNASANVASSSPKTAASSASWRLRRLRRMRPSSPSAADERAAMEVEGEQKFSSSLPAASAVVGGESDGRAFLC